MNILKTRTRAQLIIRVKKLKCRYAVDRIKNLLNPFEYKKI